MYDLLPVCWFLLSPIHTYKHAHTHTHTYTHTHTHTHTHTQGHVCLSVCLSVCVTVCMLAPWLILATPENGYDGNIKLPNIVFGQQKNHGAPF